MSVFQDGPKAESVQDSVETKTNAPDKIRKPHTFLDWQHTRKTNPSLYYRLSTQRLLISDASALGDEFFATRNNEQEDKW